MDVDGLPSITESMEVELYKSKKTKDVFGRTKVSFEAELVAFLTRPPEKQDPREEVHWKCSHIFERSFSETGEDG
jgi:hypothetical protein